MECLFYITASREISGLIYRIIILCRVEFFQLFAENRYNYSQCDPRFNARYCVEFIYTECIYIFAPKTLIMAVSHESFRQVNDTHLLAPPYKNLHATHLFRSVFSPYIFRRIANVVTFVK